MIEFGSSGLRVSKLGLGAGAIGEASLGEREVAGLLHGALDAGVTLIDSARSYGLSEERIARHLSARRDELVLSTKGGYGVDGVADWTAAAVTGGVEAALRRLGTDRIDVFFLHSCPRETLERGEVVRALSDAVRAGKVRVAGYSGENDALDWAARSGAFGALMCSVNLVDQRALDGDGALAEAARRRLGVIAKRPLANACWQWTDRPVGQYSEVYWERFAGLRERALDWPEVAARFAAFAPGVSAMVVGTRSLEHLRQIAAAVARGPLEETLMTELRAWFRAADRGWTGQV